MHPDLQDHFRKRQPLRLFDDVSAARQAALAALPPSDSVERHELHDDVYVLVFRPSGEAVGPLPATLWIHGGGYVFGAPENDVSLCQRIADTCSCVVVSVGYRLAPEHPYPVALMDCYRAFCWMIQQADALNIDSSRIAVAGGSAGGGLTAALTLLVRDKVRSGEHVVPIAFQMPLYPMIDCRNEHPSSYAITDDRVWDRASNRIAWEMYRGTLSTPDAYFSVSSATDFSDLPPTYTCIGQLDLFLDETFDYVQKLTRAGVPVEFHLYPGCFHGSELDCPEADISQNMQSNYISALKSGLALK